MECAPVDPQGRTPLSAVHSVLRPNPALMAVLAVTMLALGLALEVPWLQGLFGFASLDAGQIAEPATAALGSLLVNDLAKTAVRWFRRVGHRYTGKAVTSDRSGAPSR